MKSAAEFLRQISDAEATVHKLETRLFHLRMLATDNAHHMNGPVGHGQADQDKTGTMNVVFRDDLESVPYIDAADYLSMIKTVPFTEEKKDGEIVVSGKAGSFTVDAEKDTMTFENYYLLTKPG